MWFLWLQILFWLLIAALCGGGLVYWWMKGRYEDVTESFSSQRRGNGAVSQDLMPRKALEMRLSALDAKLDGIEKTDLAPVYRQLNDLSGQLTSQSKEFTPLKAELLGIGSQLKAPSEDPIDLRPRLDSIEARLSDLMQRDFGGDGIGDQDLEALRLDLSSLVESAFDSAPILERLSQIESRLESATAQKGDTSDLSERITQFEGTVATSLRNVYERLEQKISELENTDTSPIEQKLLNMNDQLPRLQSTLDPLSAQIRALETHMVSGNQETTRTSDALGALSQRLSIIETNISSLGEKSDPAALRSQLEQLEQSLAHLREMVFNMREKDMSTLNSSVKSMESRVDFVGVENRLTSIEYGLAATHHMLRSRFESAPLPQAPQAGPFTSAPPASATAAIFETQLSKPAAPADPVGALRISGGASNLLLEPGFGPADDLEQIKGIGPMLRQLLNDTGVYYYWQIATWSQADIDYVDEKLPGYHGRIARDNWVAQAKHLAQMPGSAQRPQPFGGEA